MCHLCTHFIMNPGHHLLCLPPVASSQLELCRQLACLLASMFGCVRASVKRIGQFSCPSSGLASWVALNCTWRRDDDGAGGRALLVSDQINNSY